ncbi:MAG: CotH kinase family protein [Flavobacteriales bacterium]|nr:CotH kinase family protein [Flavobacteriales bacterium]
MRLSALSATILWASTVPYESAAQVDLYDPGVVQEFRLYFAESNWDDLLDTLFLAGGDDRLTGDLTINGTFLPDVGVRYKGYSSYGPDRIKNPFNIKLNHVNAGQRYQGVDKLKLSNVIQDPSFVREALSYEVARDYMPASRANFARVYVNDVYIGLYTNVESVDAQFLDIHFGERDGSFVKGNPAQVDLNGENSNLSDTPGTDSTDYYPLYTLESDHGWGELLELIDVLNQHPDSIAELLNVDRALWMHAFNFALINFDSYVGYAQNYYLYRDRTGLWNPILWDLNMSFASFRLTDASLFFSGFSIAQAMQYDPLTQLNEFLLYARPLFRNVLSNDTYRRMFLAHLRTIVQEHFADGSYYTSASAMQNTIAADVLADTNKFYSDAMFFQNLDTTVNDLIDYPGIKDLMEARTSYLSGYPGLSGEPSISEVDHTPTPFSLGTALAIRARITNADTAFLAYRASSSERFTYLEMHDDGLHDDGLAGDSIFGTTIMVTSNRVQFYLYAENATAGVFSPPRAAYETYELLTLPGPGDLVINELMAYNENTVRDEHGDADDWIELFNPSGATVSTEALYLSDNADDPFKWALPPEQVAPGQYLIVWADDEVNEGALHANFALNSEGESLYLYAADTTLLDQVTFGVQYPISTTGRYPNGTGAFREMFPTFRSRNMVLSTDGLDWALQLYPNPTSGDLNAIVRISAPFEMRVLSMDGREALAASERSSNELIRLSTTRMAAGPYVVQVWNSEELVQQKFILTE